MSPYRCLKLKWTDSSACQHERIEGIADISGFRADDFLADEAAVVAVIQSHDLRALPKGEHKKVAEAMSRSDPEELLHAIIKEAFPVVADGRAASRSVHGFERLPPADEMVPLRDKYGMKLWSLKRPLDVGVD